ncbi:ShlB/FhaC/HecB family hemolysin secretion/activation protein [Klebsiella aerogenes]|uniref:ShlB/FhaC/HecB family hemolysin secretion/activation protein n=1 Tax=Klebsiella aerogenes TaxID=548 RepID=UPI000DA1782D|nr:ShlB/FhaC/HecB family hemolysin secretion/activation protein [Klebsiella aerogenes]HCB2860317.1 ShlB/FhaC/HecB family hemolysin secretion/activation protein [Klebsiella aerogenes]HCB2865491.1 ShlB/FhaC/HecB family hemolysin secretion/activation protein [Klebsiella aerogenes]HCB2881446.1 ShlB/FhaC/HecB family hemolysin secretion/activation protein [Klebsiella aerogenes]HCB3346315.1 ShlB/FhaC/HecB family hemolysin secretion/activation protein [Klebsiella aerogenes]HCM1812385.1 ShlB/FhaC/HecB 
MGRHCLSLLIPMLLSPVQIFAAPSSQTLEQQFLNQQQRQRAQEKQITPAAPDVMFSPDMPLNSDKAFPVEKNCFRISRVQLSGTKSLPHWLPLQREANKALGHCLGANGINILMGQLQNILIGHGYVTTRILAPQQDLKSGVLRLVVMPGYVRQVRLTDDSNKYVTLYSAFPAHSGNVLDLRDIEEGLENLQRLPTVQANMEIIPGDKPGESDIVITRHQDRMWRVDASLDDSGSESTGQYQGNLTLSLDNPLSLSDLFYLSGSHNLDGNGGKKSQSLTGHYSVPFGYWQAGITASDYDYVQTVAGINGDYQYSGSSKSFDVQLSRILHRSGSQKTTLTADVLAREQRNYVDDTEIEVQRRQTAAWKLGLQHRHYIGNATLDAGISYQRGTRWFGAQPAPEEYYGYGTALSKILQLNANLNIPFVLGNQNFRFITQYQRQSSNTPLTSPDMFSIGNRWTVRGFDGERTLSASHGWYVRNDIAWSTPLPAQELYLGADYGEVGGTGSETLVGKHLAGGVIGLRGQYLRASYDLFAGIPLSKPDGFKTDPVTTGFSLSWSY